MRDNMSEVLAALADIGTDEAMPVALQIDESPGRRGELFERFAARPLGPEPVFSQLLVEAIVESIDTHRDRWSINPAGCHEIPRHKPTGSLS